MALFAREVKGVLHGIQAGQQLSHANKKICIHFTHLSKRKMEVNSNFAVSRWMVFRTSEIAGSVVRSVEILFIGHVRTVNCS